MIRRYGVGQLWFDGPGNAWSVVPGGEPSCDDVPATDRSSSSVRRSSAAFPSRGPGNPFDLAESLRFVRDSPAW